MLKRFLDKKMPLFVFWAAVSMLYCLTVVAIEFHSVPVSNVHSFILAVVKWLVSAVCASGVLMVLCSSRILFAVGFPLLAVFSSVMCYYSLTIGISLTAASIEVALVNDATMWMTVISPFLIAVIALSAVVSAAIAFYRWTRVRASRRTSLTAFALGFAIICSQAFIPRIGASVQSRLPFSIYYAFNDYLNNRRAIEENRDTYTNTPVVPASTPPDVIFVIGESLRADHLPQNGYARNTMPLLSRDTALISFPEVYSEATFTSASVPVLMTKADPADPVAPYNNQSFVTLFKKAGYSTAWFANQSISQSYAYFAHECDSLIYCNGAKSDYSYDKWLDADLLPMIGGWLGKSGSPKLAVVHTIGSHWWYKSHYTDRQTRFRPDISNKEIAASTAEQIINAYDNTIIATDEFLAGLFAELRGRNAVVLFISDHGEGLGENGIYLHASDNEATHYPACFIWYTPEYARLFPDKVAAARRGKDQRHTTEAIFHTALDLGALETPALDRSKSLLK